MVTRPLRHTAAIVLFLSVICAAWPSASVAAERFFILASTTSTENSGLFRHLLPKFQATTGIAVRVIAVGTGQALRLARNGDADVLLVHHPESERALVADGHGVARHPVMHNDFVLLGPASDPAGAGNAATASAALDRIAVAKAPFASRGDDSGTHKKELSLWAAAGHDPSGASGTWYRELGAGMGATLNAASAMDAYTLADRATWASFGNKGNLAILVQGDPALLNPYSVILVSPVRHPHTRIAEGQAFIDWLLSPTGQTAIASFEIKGQQLFFPDANAASGHRLR